MENETTERDSQVKKYVVMLLIIAVGAVCGYGLFGRRREPLPAVPAGPLKVEGITCVAAGPGDELYVGGDFGVKVFNPDGRLVRQWKTAKPVKAVAVGADGSVYAASATQVEKFDKDGKSLLRWGRGGCDRDDFGLVTGLAVSGKNVFVADSAERVIYRFRSDGTYLNPIGSKEKDPDGQGIVAPSPFIDCAARGDVVLINNLGRRRVEYYDLDGKLLKHWGKSGWEDDEFPGCCNPTNIALLDDDRVVVSQKGIPVIKVFDGRGKLAAILGKDVFSEECKGIDLAVDSRGKIYAVDPVAGVVRVFEPSPEYGRAGRPQKGKGE